MQRPAGPSSRWTPRSGCTRCNPIQHGALQARGYAYASARALSTRRPPISRVRSTNPRTKISARWRGWATSGSPKGMPDAAIAAYRRSRGSGVEVRVHVRGPGGVRLGTRARRFRQARRGGREICAAAKRDPDDVALWRAWAAVLEKSGKERRSRREARGSAARPRRRLAIPVKLELTGAGRLRTAPP